jgi:hypothetical protein
MVIIDTVLRATGQTCRIFTTCGNHRIHKQSPTKLIVSASLLPKDPISNHKYQTAVPLNPSKVKDLSVAPAFGPKVKIFTPSCIQADTDTSTTNLTKNLLSMTLGYNALWI